jgi:hypothetical protein
MRVILIAVVAAAASFVSPSFGETLSAMCLLPNPPLTCIDELTGTPSLSAQDSIVKETLSIDTRIERLNELSDKTFELKEGKPYQMQNSW